MLIFGGVAPDKIPHNPKKHHLNLITNFPGIFFQSQLWRVHMPTKKKEKINQAKRCQEKLVSFSKRSSWTFQEMMIGKYRGQIHGCSTYALLTFHIPLIGNKTSIRSHEKYRNRLHSAKPFQVNCPDTESIHSTRLTHSRSLRGDCNRNCGWSFEFFCCWSFWPTLCRSLFF